MEAILAYVKAVKRSWLGDTEESHRKTH